MSKRKDKDLNIHSTAHLSGILYTTRRSTISEKEFRPKNQKSTMPSFIAAIAGWLRNMGNKLFSIKASSANGRTGEPYKKPQKAAHAAHRKQSFFQRAFEKGSALFYVGVGVSGLAAIVCAIILTSGVLEARAVEVTVNDSGRVVSAMTSAATVGDFFDKNGIVIEDGDVLEVSETAPIEAGMQIVIHRAMPLTIVSGDQETQVKMLAGTVQEALTRANIMVGPEDEVYPVLDSYVSAGMSINVIDVQQKTVTERETIYYKEITKNDSTLAKGKTKVSTKGVNGVQENTIQITYKNGVEISRKTVSEKIVVKPVDEVTLIGTYVAPKKNTPPPKTSTKPSPSATAPKDENGKLTTVPTVSQIHSGTLYEHRGVPGPAASIIKKTLVINKVTAYTHTGNRTATGTWPKIGTIAADPRQIAYGTKLYVPGYGYGRVEDTGSNMHQPGTYCLDLFMETRSECLQWGRKYNLKVYVLK